MPSSTTKQANTAKLAGAVKAGKFPTTKAGPAVKSMAKMPMSKLKHFMKVKECMSLEQKRRLLIGLRKLKEEYTGNVGGETDITYADNLQVSENEFTAATKPERNPVAQEFEVQGNLEDIMKKYRGLEMTSKERQSLVKELAPPKENPIRQKSQPTPESNPNKTPTVRITKSVTFTDDTNSANTLADLIQKLGLQNDNPVEQGAFFVKYEKVDDFGKNTTTVIKKQKEGNQMCWTAFSQNIDAQQTAKAGI